MIVNCWYSVTLFIAIYPLLHCKMIYIVQAMILTIVNSEPSNIFFFLAIPVMIHGTMPDVASLAGPPGNHKP